MRIPYYLVLQWTILGCFMMTISCSGNTLQCNGNRLVVSKILIIDRPSQIARFMGPTWDPPGSCRPQVGHMLIPWTLLSGIACWRGWDLGWLPLAQIWSMFYLHNCGAVTLFLLSVVLFDITRTCVHHSLLYVLILYVSIVVSFLFPTLCIRLSQNLIPLARLWNIN